MAMWCVLAAPLIVGCDMTRMTPDTLRILTAKGPLAVDQDQLGVQGTVCFQTEDKRLQVWRKPLADGSIAVVAINRDANVPAAAGTSTTGANITIDLGKCGHGGGETKTVIEDVWSGKTLATITGSSYTTSNIPLHGPSMLALNTKGYSSTYLAMGFANVRAGTQTRRGVFGYPPEH